MRATGAATNMMILEEGCCTADRHTKYVQDRCESDWWGRQTYESTYGDIRQLTGYNHARDATRLRRGVVTQIDGKGRGCRAGRTTHDERAQCGYGMSRVGCASEPERSTEGGCIRKEGVCWVK